MTKALILIILLTATISFAQENSLLYQDGYVKVSFKPINADLGYIIEDYNGSYGGTLVKYSITDESFIVEEIDSIIIADSMIFLENNNYKTDSIQLSFRYRTNEFEGSLTDNNLTYIINDKYEYKVGQTYKNDQFHRALIPIQETPYQLKIKTGRHIIGPFTIKSKVDVNCKVVVLMSTRIEEFDHGKLLPTEITFNNNQYNFIHNFKAWN